MAHRTEGANLGNAMLMATLAGLTGAAIALLFAPRNGKETREKIKSEAHDLKERAKSRTDSAKAALGTKVEQIKGMKNRTEDSLSEEIQDKEES